MRVLQLVGASLAAMAAVSALIFEAATRDRGLSVSAKSGHARMMKGEHYETVISVRSRGDGWIGSTPTSFSIDTGQLADVEPVADGTGIRLRFLGRYAGRSEGIRVGVSFTDPLRLFTRLEQTVTSELVLDTMPLSLVSTELGRRLKVVGYGERSSGYAGQGQELYKLDEYNPGYTKDIVWRRLAQSPEEALMARVREADVRGLVKVGVVRFAEREGEERARWTDGLCEALGEVGREVLETGAGVVVLYHEPPAGGRRPTGQERLRGMVSLGAADVDQLADAVMASSAAPGSRDVGAVVEEADLVVTGLLELQDAEVASILSRKPLLLLYEDAPPPPPFLERPVVWTGKEDLLPLIRRTLER
ncbi:MAG: hypothetical protein JRN58_04470 [Nitrososphaerota archaeon]|nr:hypothetical protein [Nitrososphaerota archaeon]